MASDWTIGKLLSVILVVVLLALIIYGISTKAINPLTEKMVGMADGAINSIKSLFGLGEKVDIKREEVDVPGVGKGQFYLVWCDIVMESGDGYRLNFEEKGKDGKSGRFEKWDKSEEEFVDYEDMLLTDQTEFENKVYREIVKKVNGDKIKMNMWNTEYEVGFNSDVGVYVDFPLKKDNVNTGRYAFQRDSSENDYILRKLKQNSKWEDVIVGTEDWEKHEDEYEKQIYVFFSQAIKHEKGSDFYIDFYGDKKLLYLDYVELWQYTAKGAGFYPASILYVKFEETFYGFFDNLQMGNKYGSSNLHRKIGNGPWQILSELKTPAGIEDMERAIAIKDFLNSREGCR